MTVRTVEPILEVGSTVGVGDLRQVRLGARYERSLEVLQHARRVQPETPTKSGLMLGLGETAEEVLQVMRDLRGHGVGILTLGQYLRP